MVSRLGLGCWALGGDSYGAVNEKDARLLLETAYDHGVKFFDTSPAYGNGLSEERIGRYLSKRNGVTIATKVGMLPHSSKDIPYDFSTHFIKKSIDFSLKRLQIESIDLVQLHSPILGFEKEFDEIFLTLNSLIAEGKVKSFGISLRSPLYFNQQGNLYDWKSYQYNLSILDQRILSVVKDMSPILKTTKFLIARTPLNFGFLTESPPKLSKLNRKHHLSGWDNGQFEEWEFKVQKIRTILQNYDHSLLQAALRFPIDSCYANLVIPGARNQKEFLNNFQAFDLGKISDGLISELKQHFRLTESKMIETPYTYVRGEK